MNEKMKTLMAEIEPKLLAFCQDIVRIKSYTGKEEEVILRIEREMVSLGYDKVVIDANGSVIGIIGTGDTRIYFDGHTDTVVAKPEEWSFDPWAGDIVDGYLRGRGSTDMKSSAAASVYGAYLARELGLTEGKTVYVSCSVMEEDYEGTAVQNEFSELNFKPDYAVICEPTRLRIGNGHHGRALFEVTAKGKSIHASRHQLGDNALNKALKVAERVEKFGKMLLEADGAKGAIASTKLVTDAPSINSIPGLAVLTIDRRITPESTEETLADEMNLLCDGIPDVTWKIVDTMGESWTGKDVVLRNMINAWQTDPSHHLIETAKAAVQELGVAPEVYRRNGCTNGWVTGGAEHIPTIIFGAGDEANCHVINETCPVSQIPIACQFYAALIGML